MYTLNNIDGIVFDMDGVIFDTEAVCMECWLTVGKRYGLENVEYYVRLCTGRNEKDTERIVTEAYGDKHDIKKLRAEVNDEEQDRDQVAGDPHEDHHAGKSQKVVDDIFRDQQDQGDDGQEAGELVCPVPSLHEDREAVTKIFKHVPDDPSMKLKTQHAGARKCTGIASKKSAFQSLTYKGFEIGDIL